jgi:chitinase
VQDVPLRYGELERKGYLSHGVRRWDDRAQSTYRVFGGAGYVPRIDPRANPAGMLSYEDRQSIAAKANWVHRTGTGGTILWTLNYGWVERTRSNPLLAQVRASFLGR